MVTVAEAEKIILSERRDYGTETIGILTATGRVLAHPIIADRDLPPFHRATMDGIAVNYRSIEKGITSFKIIGTQAAGEPPIEIGSPAECTEIMTGAAMPFTTDMVIRYEDLLIEDGVATLQTTALRQGQNIHKKGSDKKQSATLVGENKMINAAIIGLAASVGASSLTVKKHPRIVIISTGNELVPLEEAPNPWQVRRSNNYMIHSALQQNGMSAGMVHIPDDLELSKTRISECLQQYDVLLLSGGISMGKFDFIPAALKAVGVEKLFHKVQQKPGKPFWFGKQQQSGPLVFAFPGNPVSTFLCFYRYFLPWLRSCLGVQPAAQYAILQGTVLFSAPLQYFMQVKIQFDESAACIAVPLEGNGSGDFANLEASTAFMELPQERNNFNPGEMYRIWPFKSCW